MAVRNQKQTTHSGQSGTTDNDHPESDNRNSVRKATGKVPYRCLDIRNCSNTIAPTVYKRLLSPPLIARDKDIERISQLDKRHPAIPTEQLGGNETSGEKRLFVLPIRTAPETPANADIPNHKRESIKINRI